MDIKKILANLGLSKDIQSVGFMTMIPIIGSDIEGVVADPSHIIFDGTRRGYGNMGYENTDTELPAIVPANTMVLTNQSAQDHAMSGIGIIKKRSSVIFDDACCVQQRQGGYIDGRQISEFDILPHFLRLCCFSKRGEHNYGKLWKDIENFQKELIDGGYGAHIIYFFQKFKDELGKFIAQFEPIPQQRGAVIYIGDQIAGIELVPTHAYWLYVWKALVRGCYGAETIRRVKLGSVNRGFGILPNIANQFTMAQTMDEMLECLEKTTKSTVEDVLLDIGRLPRLTLEQDRKEIGNLNALLALTEEKFGGDVVTHGEKPVYASLLF